jgi:sialate O-acetylesterase
MNSVRHVFLFLSLLFAGLIASAQVRLPQLIADKMVLQRDIPLTIWGWASPRERITLEFAGRRYRTSAAADSSWQVRVPAMKAGGPYALDIRASNHLVISDILIGDVWFCSGQSNMVLSMERVKEKYPDDIAVADFPEIRNFFVPTAADIMAVHDDLPSSGWKEANLTNVLAFGAATYFFARDLYQKYHVPIGIINSSVGGTPIQAWISGAGLAGLSRYADRITKFHDPGFMRQFRDPEHSDVAPFRGNLTNRPEATDRGLAGTVKWYSPDFVPVGWHPFWLPGYWADQGVKGLNGVIWFRKEIEVPASMAGKPAKLFVGRIVDADETYLNGVKVGNITYQYPPRRYEVPAGLLKEGKNLLVVRVTNTSGKGGFVPDKRYELTDGVTHIDIRGDWQYKVGRVFLHWGETDGRPVFSAQNEPTGLYNTMVAPAIRYGVKGFLWYQGEANTGNPREYRELLPALIADWRVKWQEGDIPFLYVQLPNFMEVQYSPSESQWAELREAQLDALAVPNTGMAVTIDAGEWNDVHPLDKKDVGDRLALAAERLAYRDTSVISSGPIFQSARIDGDSIILSFTGIGSGLSVKGGGELQQFAIAGADKKFVWGDARIEGTHVIVANPYISRPKYVRYAWADNPEGANLYNKEGLPASPFRTDQEK